MFFIPDSIVKIYQDLKKTGATIIIPGRTGTNHHFEETEHSIIRKETGFKVSWPGGWLEDRVLEHAVMSQMGWPMNIYTNTIIVSERADILLPKISIVVENVGNIDIIDYTHKRLNILTTHQTETLDYDVCKDFHTVTEIMLYKPTHDLESYQIQKSFLRNNKAYVFNIFDVYPEKVEKKPGLTTDIIKIVRSFTFLDSTVLSQ